MMKEAHKQRVGLMIADLAGVQMRIDELLHERKTSRHRLMFDFVENDLLSEASRMLDEVVNLLRDTAGYNSPTDDDSDDD